jgi:hypothetical protein
MEKRSCSLAEGPNCFQVSNFKEIEDSEYLMAIMEKLKLEKANISLETLYRRLNQELLKFKEKHKSSISEVFKFKPKIMMNLLLNFESYDQTTKEHDIYMPEEKVIHFNVGHLKMNFRGKLRLTQNVYHDDIKADFKSGMDTPAKTYGVVEEDLTIKFDKPVYVKQLYIRPHVSDDLLYETRVDKNYITGSRYNKEVFINKIFTDGNSWVRILIKFTL